MSPYPFTALRRKPWASLTAFFLCGVFCFFLCYLQGYLKDQQDQLETIQDTFDIPCVVTNLTGSQSQGLRLGSVYIDSVRDDVYPLPAYIRDLELTKEFYFPDSQTGENQLLLGVTGEKCADSLNPALGANADYFDPDFYSRTDPVCLVSSEAYEQNGLQPGSLLRLQLTDPAWTPIVEGTTGQMEVVLEVAGVYAGQGKTLYLPFPAAEELMMEMSGMITGDSIRFYPRDNRQLQQLAEAAAPKFTTVDPSGAVGLYEYALVIHDEQYQAATATVLQNIRRVRLVLPVLLGISLGLGVLISYLSTRSQRHSYALMRTLGLGRGGLFATVLAQQLLPALPASLAVGLATFRPAAAGLYFGCYALGCCTAAWAVARAHPLEMVKRQE